MVTVGQIDCLGEIRERKGSLMVDVTVVVEVQWSLQKRESLSVSSELRF
jgi:hypothetical protein